jgi:hypothetical protein
MGLTKTLPRPKSTRGLPKILPRLRPVSGRTEAQENLCPGQGSLTAGRPCLSHPSPPHAVKTKLARGLLGDNRIQCAHLPHVGLQVIFQ